MQEPMQVKSQNKVIAAVFFVNNTSLKRSVSFQYLLVACFLHKDHEDQAFQVIRAGLPENCVDENYVAD